jgi:hypothetical protein
VFHHVQPPGTGGWDSEGKNMIKLLEKNGLEG